MIQSAPGPGGKLGALPAAGSGRVHITCHTPAPSAGVGVGGDDEGAAHGHLCPVPASPRDFATSRNSGSLRFLSGNANMLSVALASQPSEEQEEGTQCFSNLSKWANGRWTLLRQPVIQWGCYEV